MSTTTERDQPPRARRPDLLRRSLRVDGWGTAVFGVVVLAAGPRLGGPLGLPPDWLVPIGIATLGGAAALGLIAGYPRIPPSLAALAIAGNTLSGVAMLVVVLTGALPLTAPGVAFLLAGTAWVATFAVLASTGLRRLRAAGTTTADDGVTFINVFEIPEDRLDRFAAHWRERAEMLRGAPGFRDVRLHRALTPDARFRLVNVAHWDSREAWETATRNGRFRASTAEAAALANPNPALYEVVAEYP